MMELKGKIGKYIIIKKIGSGGFGTVYLAEDSLLKTKRALKIPHRTGNKLEKTLQESVIQCSLLNHPNIVKLLTVDIINNSIIMVMEYIKGSDLETAIDTKESLDINSALKYFKQILSALEFAHKNKIIHRDIRPSNILLDENDNIKITDFGTSTSIETRQYATTRIGSPPYMAPEQFEGKAVLASDIYSAGCLFYEMVTGFPPIVLANPMEIYRKIKAGGIIPLTDKIKISVQLNRIIMKMLEPDLNRRYKTITEVIRDLEAMNAEPVKDNSSEIQRIKRRISARSERTDFQCWKCRKVMARPMKKCPYCGEEQ